MYKLVESFQVRSKLLLLFVFVLLANIIFCTYIIQKQFSLDHTLLELFTLHILTETSLHKVDGKLKERVCAYALSPTSQDQARLFNSGPKYRDESTMYTLAFGLFHILRCNLSFRNMLEKKGNVTMELSAININYHYLIYINIICSFSITKKS